MENKVKKEAYSLKEWKMEIMSGEKDAKEEEE